MPPSQEQFSVSAVNEGLTFFQRYPRFTPDERKRFLLELAEPDGNHITNNSNNNFVPLLADVCIELPSKKSLFCHKALLAAGSDYFRTLLETDLALHTIKIDMTDVEFTSVQRFLYNGSVSLDSKPFTFFQELLPKLVKMNLKEYVSHCACHLSDSVHDEDKNDAHGYVLSVLTLADRLELKPLHEYCIWWMQVNFDTIKEHAWFMNEMTTGNREEVVRGQWPGVAYRQLYDEWKAVFNKKGLKKKDKGKDCIVQ
eukprot:TRINITY_DN4047_c0_g1_i1.p1 TRINITY_DN4047_c0_g1~~TRINITY_DN4047_c0_g1_i1.p1  ORF type:complete len:255 (+),score=46.29 TRINITY_DN4047_c0_g1_i1:259-1023(+)